MLSQSKKILFISGLLLVFMSCNSNVAKEDKMKEQSQVEHKAQKRVIYQMMTRLFGNKETANVENGTVEENGIGKFDDITSVALDSLREMGITDVWYTGVIEHAQMEDLSEFGIAVDDPDVVKGRAGSPYAIKDYFDVDPMLANDVKNRMGEFENLVARTHDAGLRVLIDFVPNHVARSYKSDACPEGYEDFGVNDDLTKAFDVDNNFYYILGEHFQAPEGYQPLGDRHFIGKDGKFDEFPAKATGNDVFTSSPSIHDWFETIKLNYGVDYQNERKGYFEDGKGGVPDTWLKVKGILTFWADKGVDGFRCDMAEMVPVEFWNWIIPEIKKINPEIVFIAEIYNPAEYSNYIETGKFDYLYDKVDLYDTLKHIMQGKSKTDYLPEIADRLESVQPNMLRFLENHDEQRIASPDFVGDAKVALPGMVVSALWEKGPVMVYFGQEVGEPGAGSEGFGGEDGRTTIFDYWGVPDHQKWMNDGKFDGGMLSDEQKALRQYYSKLLNIAKDEQVFADGDLIDLQRFNRKNNKGYSEHLYAFVRDNGADRALVICNFSKDEGYEGTVEVDSDLINKWNAQQGVKTVDLMTGDIYQLQESQVKLALKPLQSVVLKF
ncbi:alpha-amylase family protein [Aureibacter tunicatorum]|uniref:Glycosidase n=1 Tax=Aureibacter tunicatorum TaxID=866807 RepID=A0AAE3XLI1_9BACT|nr:alpha-amylase family protein [Aureibacter tunicatorum]MDR6238700.1 glycosidase [Aureibacter tunicatorum]BDD05369.1 alpha-amylase [Aureibacter tunicatorum]